MEKPITLAATYLVSLNPIEAVAVILSLAFLGLVFKEILMLFKQMGVRFR